MNGILQQESHNTMSHKREKHIDKRDVAIKIRKAAWQVFFKVSGFDKKNGIDEEVDQTTLSDPSDPITSVLIYMYSMDTFIPIELNKASRMKDLTKVETLGPFAAVLNHIVIGANK